MKKLFCLVFVLAMVCSLLFAFNVSAEEGTLKNVASESTITTNAGPDTWWIHQNKDNLKDGDPTTGMHSSNKEGTTVVTFTLPAEKRITKIVMLVNGSATTTAMSPTNMNAATDYKVTVGGYTETKNAKDQTELVFNLDQTTDTVTIEFKSNWGWGNALIREVEIYEYTPEEVFNGKNIEDEATIQTTDGNSYIVGGSNYLVDNDPFTGLSAGNAASWINYHFLYEEGRNINRVVVVVNSTGTMYKVGSADGTYVHETMSTLPNIYLRLYDASDAIKYQLTGVSTEKAVAVELNGKTYKAYTFDLGGEVYPDIVKVEVATVHNKDTKLGVWEVEIFEHQCELDGHKFAAATCAAPETCIYCGTTQGEPSAEHTGTWSVATCTTKSTCSVCGDTTGELDADNHTWKDATCNAPKTCVDCKVTEGEPTGEHEWVDVSCAAPKHCSGCGLTEGEALPHANILKDGNCTTDDKCRVCKQVAVAAIAHNLDANGYCTNEGCYYRNIEKNVASSAEVTTSPAGWWAVGPKWWVDGDWNTGSHAPKSGTFSYIFTYGSEMNFSRFVIVANGLCYAPNDGKDANNNAIIGVKVTLKDADGNKVYETTAYSFDTNDIEIVLPYPMTAVSATFTFTSTQQYGSSFVREIEIYEPKIEGCGVHNFEVVQGATASCTVDGSYSVVCSVCKAVESVHVTPATGHKIGTDYVVINRTCTSAPVLQFACTVCGETEEREIQVNDIIDRADKTSITTIHSGGGTTAATMFDGSLDTWTQASGSWAVIGTINFDRAYYLSSVTVWIEGSSVGTGLIVYYQAPGSDEWIQAGDAMAVHAPWGEIGEFTYEIKGEIYASAIKVYVGDADGTPQGGGPGLYSFNGRLYDVAVTGSLEKEIAAGHTWVAGDAVAADCDDYGYTPYTCSVCGETKKSDFVNATGHKWVNATCVAPKTCSVCELTDGEALEHNFVASEPDENGAVTYSCNKGCEDSYVINNTLFNGTYYADAMTSFVFENGVLVANGETFNYTYNVTTGVLTVDGMPEGMLAYVEGKIIFRGRVELHQHNEADFIVETVDATCTENGSITTICQFCGPLSVETIEATGHTWLEGEYLPANCSNEGWQDYYCKNCDATKHEVTAIDPDKHQQDYSQESEYVAATCKEEGYYKYVCFYCHEQITEVQPVDTDWGHKWVVLENIQVTCKNDGYFKQECSLCGAVDEDTTEMDPEYPAHTWNDGEEITGGLHYTCTTCGEEKTEITKGTSYDPIEAVIGNNAVVYYVEGSTEVYFYVPVGAGTVTVTIDETAGVKVAASPMMMGWMNFSTGSTTYTTELEDNSGCFICISLDAETYTVPESFSLSFAEKSYPELEIGDNEIAVDAWSNYECVVSVPGTYFLSVGENTNIIIPNEYGFEMIEQYPYEFTIAEGERILFMVTTANHEAGTAVVTLVEKVEHVHTEVEIPAVRPAPSNNHIGWSAGVMCSECEAILVAPVEMVAGTSSDANFKINSATLSLGEDIGVTYNATHPANSDPDSMYMVFVFDGKEFFVEKAGIVAGNRYRFVFKGMRADLMAANIEAYVYAIENGNYVMKSHLKYSVKQYCVNQLKRTIDAKFAALIYSVLNLGDCTQLAVNSETPAEQLVSKIVTAETGKVVPAIAVETIDPSYNVQAITGDRKQGYDWKSGGIALGSSVQLKLQFVATEVEGLVLKFDIAGARTIEIDASELTKGTDGRYTVYFQVKALEYDDTITCTFEKDGQAIGSSLTYSVYTYLVRSYTNTKLPEADRNFMKALYEYAEAIKAMNN